MVVCRFTSFQYLTVIRKTKFINFCPIGNRLVQTLIMTDGTQSLAGMRHPYHSTGNVFDESDLVSKEPFGNFRHWFEATRKEPRILEPNAMALATATKDGRPSVRMVLLKAFSENGFTFFTNFESRKGKELTENPLASLLFYWEPFKRQIRIEGTVTKLSEEEATTYFHSRPKQSQIGASVSKQSEVIKDRKVLETKRLAMEEQYKDETKLVPKPPYWGGYLLKPHSMEFWQGQTDRLHDRIVFRRLRPGEVIDPAVTKNGTDGWVYERLYP